MKSTFKTLSLTAATLAISISGNAFAATLSLTGGASLTLVQGSTIPKNNGISSLYGASTNSISGFKGGTLEISDTATVTLTYLGTEAYNVNAFKWSGSDIFKTRGATDTCSGGNCGIWSSTGFEEMTKDAASGALTFSFNSIANGGDSIFAYKVNDTTYDLWFNDSGSSDSDYDDMVVRVSTSPVPIPAAVWLFGSALMGLAGVGYRSRSAQA